MLPTGFASTVAPDAGAAEAADAGADVGAGAEVEALLHPATTAATETTVARRKVLGVVTGGTSKHVGSESAPIADVYAGGNRLGSVDRIAVRSGVRRLPPSTLEGSPATGDRAVSCWEKDPGSP
jgi:hypothetical protein